MSVPWSKYASLTHEEAELSLSSGGYLLAAIHRAFVDGDWMAVAYDKKGRKYAAKGRNPHEAVCRLAWELMMRSSNQQGSTGRK